MSKPCHLLVLAARASITVLTRTRVQQRKERASVDKLLERRREDGGVERTAEGDKKSKGKGMAMRFKGEGGGGEWRSEKMRRSECACGCA